MIKFTEEPAVVPKEPDTKPKPQRKKPKPQPGKPWTVPYPYDPKTHPQPTPKAYQELINQSSKLFPKIQLKES